MTREVQNVWKCNFCGSRIEAKPQAFNIIYTDERNEGICPICGTHTLVKIAEIFRVD